MTSNSKAEVAEIIDRDERQPDGAPARMRDPQEAVAGWEVRARHFVRTNPGTALIGALALGFVLARAARHA